MVGGASVLSEKGGDWVSINLDFSVLWPTVNNIVNGLWVAFAVPLGVVFGFAILKRIIGEVRRAFGS